MIVVKFGGTSVADATAITRAIEIVRGRLDREPIVVVSALAGTTNALLAIADQASRGQLIGAVRAVEALRERHLAQAAALLGEGGDADELSAELSAMFDELAHLAEALSVLGDLTPRSKDAIAAMGERLSSQLVVAAMRRGGLEAEHVDARDVMITDDRYCGAEPLTDLIAEASRDRLLPLVRQGRVPVLGGFIGATRTGVTTTLGRGGSDYSAALVGAALGADAIEIWTDVDGMLTADPRVVKGAKLIEQIRFDEASELASFGAKVLHPSTIAPAVERGIPVWIFNSRNPSGNGTRITHEAPRRAVSAIASRSGIVLLQIRTARMLLVPGFLRRFFEVFERMGVSVDVVATSEVSVSVTIDDREDLDDLLVELRELGDVTIARGKGVLAVVGAGIGDGGEAMGRALGALAGVRVHLVSLSAVGINLSVVIDEAETAAAMCRLHEAFFGTGATGE
ncbi:MAG TPA: lysine-sensitive aspartokinase 3 [Gemmatimonadaceae bacterium]|nr:lysine-sensitive aspartokinase 3 [Gemmatimonadaceae bacterium]